MLARARTLFPHYADRSAFPEHVERLARNMARDYERPLTEVDRDFHLPASTASKVQDIRHGMEAQFMHQLRALMHQRPDLITYSDLRLASLSFDVEAAGAPDEIKALARTRVADVSDMAATILKTKDPERHMLRLKAPAKLRNEDKL